MRSTTPSHEPIGDQTSDAALIACIAAGQDKALDLLMQRYKKRLYAFIYRYLREEETAYDIIQETFIRVYRHARRYKPDYAASTWIYSIAMNLCRDHARRQKLRRWVSLDWMPGSDDQENEHSLHDIIPDPSSNVEHLLEVKESLTLMRNAIERLPHDLKTALILFHLEGYSQEKCAETLGVTTKTIETRVYRARKMLAEKLVKRLGS
jgi:RNA polymerase sigma-70 factor (ECF subfamily)